MQNVQAISSPDYLMKPTHKISMTNLYLIPQPTGTWSPLIYAYM
jgi:hypothetical protein